MEFNNKYYNLIKPNIDDFGVIANMPGNDEGDSSNREGSFALVIRELYDLGRISEEDYNVLRMRYRDVLRNLKCGHGGIRRGIDTSEWTGQNDVMSRDQWIPNVIACGSLGLDDLSYFFLGHLLRGLLFTTNTCPNEYMTGQPGGEWKLPDLTVLSSWGLYIRAYKAWLLYPFLIIFDIEILVNSCIIVYQSYYNPTETDVINQLNKLIQAKRRLPTPVSWLSAHILKYDKRGMQACLDAYFAPDLNGPRLNMVYKDILPTLVK